LTRSPSGHAATSTPGSVPSRSKFSRRAAGFAKSTEARHSHPKAFRCGSLRFMLRPVRLPPPFEADPDASTSGSPTAPAICYGASWPLPRRDFRPLVIEPFTGRTWIRAYSARSRAEDPVVTATAPPRSARYLSGTAVTCGLTSACSPPQRVHAGADEGAAEDATGPV